jgi:MFS transporter, DHA3 family, macrolide efflux protein
MKDMLQNRGLRLIFIANMVSMIGSGMNSAAVTWFVLQATHSEMALGTLLMLQTIPVFFLLTFSGVVIDREDRRHLVMMLDAFRGVVVLAVAILASHGAAKLWEVYLMNILVSAGFWMFWPTMNALLQELTPESRFVQANSFLLAGFQGGWLIAGALVGFVYGAIGLGGILLIDFVSYVISFGCYLFIRKGRHTVTVTTSSECTPQGSAAARFFHELHEGIAYIVRRPSVLLMGSVWALFLGAMLTQGVISAPYSDHLLKAGAIGYGWINAGWAIGAFLGAVLTPKFIGKAGSRSAVAISMSVLGVAMISLPQIGSHVHGELYRGISAALATSVLVYAIMGCCRGFGGVAITSVMMTLVPKHFMGRVQNTFYFIATCLQFGLAILVGAVAHTKGLTLGFFIIGSLYLIAFAAAVWKPADRPEAPKDQAGEQRDVEYWGEKTEAAEPRAVR